MGDFGRKMEKMPKLLIFSAKCVIIYKTPEGEIQSLKLLKG